MTLYSSSSGMKRTRIGEVNVVLTLGSIALVVAALVSFAASAIGKLGVVVAPLADGQDEREKDVMTFEFAKDGKITEQPPHLTHLDPILSLQSEGFTTLDLAHREGKIHTGSWIFVVDSSDKLLLLRRGPELVTCPLAWSMVGEHAYRDETKKDTLKRGIEEELGYKTWETILDTGSYAELTDLPLFYFRDYGPEREGRIDRQVTHLWLVELGVSAEEADAKIMQLDEEVHEHKWMPLEEAEKWVQDDMAAIKEGERLDNFCHDTIGSLMQVGFDRIRAIREKL